MDFTFLSFTKGGRKKKYKDICRHKTKQESCEKKDAVKVGSAPSRRRGGETL